MFSDMDNNLREIGVSDLSVGRRMRAMWEAFHGRSQAYTAAINAMIGPPRGIAGAQRLARGAAQRGICGACRGRYWTRRRICRNSRWQVLRPAVRSLSLWNNDP